MRQTSSQWRRRVQARGETSRPRHSLGRGAGENGIERAALAMREIAERRRLALVGHRHTRAEHDAVRTAERRHGGSRRERQSQDAQRISDRQPGSEPGAAKTIKKGGASLHGRKWRRLPGFVKPRIAAYGGRSAASGEYSSPGNRFFKRTIRLTKRTISIRLRVFPEQSGNRGDLSSSLRRVTKR